MYLLPLLPLLLYPNVDDDIVDVVDCAAAKQFVAIRVMLLRYQLSQAEMENWHWRHQQRLSSPHQVESLSLVSPYCIQCVVNVDDADAAASVSSIPFAQLQSHQQVEKVNADLMKVQVIDDAMKNVALWPPSLPLPFVVEAVVAALVAAVGTLYCDLFEHKLSALHNTYMPAGAVSSHD